MEKHFLIIVLIYAVAHFPDCSKAMSKAQVKQAAKLMRNICQPKNKVTNEQVDNIKSGEFIDDPAVKCYIACVFTMAQSVKNGKLNYESGLKQIDIMMPENMKEPLRVVLTECKYIADKYKDLCEASFQMAQCMFASNKDVFIFP